MNKIKRNFFFTLTISLLLLFGIPQAVLRKTYSADNTITLETTSGGSYTIEYLGRSSDGLTWSYQVSEEEDSRDLSHWVLGLFQCLTEDNIISTNPEHSDLNTDPVTGIYGIKWDSSDVPGFEDDSNDSVRFSITFDQIYEEAEDGVQVAVKTGGNESEEEEAKIAVGYITGPSCEVENVKQVCEIGPHWAAEVTESRQGTLNNDDLINDPNRINPEDTLNANDAEFFSIGKNGEIILSFEHNIYDIVEDSPEDIFGNGWDLAFFEITWGNRFNYPEERITVSISQDGLNWHTLGEAGSHDNDTGTSYFDISVSNLPWFKYVKITDSTDFNLHDPDADGYDLDAVSAAYTCYEEINSDPANLVLVKNSESQTVYPGEYLTYNLTYTNTGEDPARGAKITETIPQHTTFEGMQGWVCSPDTYPALPGIECVFDLGDIAPGEEGQVQFTVKVDNEIEDTNEIINIAIITADSEEEFLNDNTSTANTPLLQTAEKQPKKDNDDATNQGQFDPITAPMTQPIVLSSNVNSSIETKNPGILAATGQTIIPLSIFGLILLSISKRFQILGRKFLICRP